MSDRIERTVHIEADAGVVFAALSSADLLSKWLCQEAQAEPRVGGKYELEWRGSDDGAVVHYHASAEVLEIEPSAHLRLELAPEDGPSAHSVIDFRVASNHGETDLVVTQTGFGEGSDPNAYERGWVQCLRVLRSLLEDEPATRLVHAPLHRDLPTPAHDPCGIEWDCKSLWMSDAGSGRIYEIDPRTGDERGSIPFAGEPSGLAFDGRSLWQADREEATLVKLDRHDGRVLKRVPIDGITGELTGVTWDGKALWVGDSGEHLGRVLHVNPATGEVATAWSIVGSVSGLAWDGNKLWAADFENRLVRRVDPGTGTIDRRIAVKGHPTGLAWDGHRLWYADAEWRFASRILDPVFGD